MISIENNKLKKLFAIFIIIFLIPLSSNIFADDDTSTSGSTSTINDLNIYSNSCILIDPENNNIIYEKNAFSKIYPASTTKILTAILAIENLNLDDAVVASKNAVMSIPSDSSSAYIQVGETLTVKELLYCLLLKSGNDAANVLAEKVSGDIDSFVELMNEKAKEIGCKNTHFVNAHGYHDDDHYTTAYDMALIMKYAIQNETFRSICETKSYVIDETNKTNEKRYLKNTDKLILDDDNNKVFYEYALGGKTGYTIEARGTFVGYAKKGDLTLLVATFDASQNINGLEGRFLDAINLYNYGFDNFTIKNIIDKDNFSFEVKDEENKKIYTVSLKENIDSSVDSSKYATTYSTDFDFSSIANLKNEEIIGKEIGDITFNIISNTWSSNKSTKLIVTDVKNIFSFKSIFEGNNKLIFIAILTIFLLIVIFISKRSSNKKVSKNYNYDFNKEKNRVNLNTRIRTTKKSDTLVRNKKTNRRRK